MRIVSQPDQELDSVLNHRLENDADAGKARGQHLGLCGELDEGGADGFLITEPRPHAAEFRAMPQARRREL